MPKAEELRSIKANKLRKVTAEGLRDFNSDEMPKSKVEDQKRPM